MKKLALAVMMVLVSACATYPPHTTVSVTDEILIKGVDYAAEGKFKEAKEEFEKALKVDPFSGSTKESLKVIEDVTFQKIESKTAIHFFKGAVYAIKGKGDQAIGEYNRAIEINPGFAIAYRARGKAYLKKRQYDKAISDYNKAIKLDPKYSMAYHHRGFTYYCQGQYEKAITDCSKAIEINPKSVMAYINRGKAYADKGQYDQAISDYTKAIEINPKSIIAYNNRGLAYAEGKGRYGRANSDYNKAIELTPWLRVDIPFDYLHPSTVSEGWVLMEESTGLNREVQYRKDNSSLRVAINCYPDPPSTREERKKILMLS